MHWERDEATLLMNRVIEELICYKHFPVLSVIASLGLAGHENEMKLRRVLAHAFDLTPKSLLKVDRDIFFARLELMLSNLSTDGYPESVALFVGKDFTRIVPLNYAVRDRIVIDGSCALSEVVYSSTMFPCFNVIVLYSTQARIFKTCAERLLEIKNCQLVDHLSSLLKNHVDAINASRQDNGKHGKTSSSYAHKLHHAFLALLRNLDHPAIIIGSDRIGQLCPEMTKYVSGFAEGDYEYVSNAEIGRLAAEMADAWVKSKMRQGMAAIENYRHYKKLGSGVDEVEAMVEEGCVEKLYLEALQATTVELCDSHRLTEIDKIISSAYKSEAEIFFLPAGSLSAYNGMAAGLRY